MNKIKKILNLILKIFKALVISSFIFLVLSVILVFLVTYLYNKYSW